jgi:hypothetical protein
MLSPIVLQDVRGCFINRAKACGNVVLQSYLLPGFGPAGPNPGNTKESTARGSEHAR